MKILADENVDKPIISRFRHDGHELESIAEESPGLPDEDVLSRAWRSGVLLISGDKDFGELVYRKRLPHAGVLLLRISGLSEEEKCELVSKTIAQHGTQLAGAFSVLTPFDLRIRHSPST